MIGWRFNRKHVRLGRLDVLTDFGYNCFILE